MCKKLYVHYFILFFRRDYTVSGSNVCTRAIEQCCIVLYSISLCYALFYWTILYRTIICCLCLELIPFYCTPNAALFCWFLCYCFCIVMYCFAWHCIVLQLVRVYSLL
jgi:hypothetical protein